MLAVNTAQHGKSHFVYHPTRDTDARGYDIPSVTGIFWVFSVKNSRPKSSFLFKMPDKTSFFWPKIAKNANLKKSTLFLNILLHLIKIDIFNKCMDENRYFIVFYQAF